MKFYIAHGIVEKFSEVYDSDSGLVTGYFSEVYAVGIDLERVKELARLKTPLYGFDVVEVNFAVYDPTVVTLRT